MPGKTIDQLPSLSSLSSSDELVVWDSDGGSTNTKKVTIGTLLSWLGQHGLGLTSTSSAAEDANKLWGVKSTTQSSPPPTPSTGDKYLVPAGSSGAWAGQDNKIAVWDGSSWQFYDLNVGDSIWVIPDDKLFVVDDSGLIEITNQPVSIPNLQNLPFIGINATADSTDRFVAKTTRASFDNDTNDLDVIINSTDPTTNYARLSFASNMSVRYTIGIEGGDFLKFHKSVDGSNFDEVLTLNLDGRFVFPSSAPFSIESPSVNLYGQNDGIVDIIRKTSGSSGEIRFSTASANTGKGARIRSDGGAYLRLDRTDDHSTWNRILHINNNGEWESNKVDWKTIGINLAPSSTGPELSLTKNSINDRCQLSFKYQTSFVKLSFDNSNNFVISEKVGSSENSIVTINTSTHAFDFGSAPFKIKAAGVEASSNSGQFYQELKGAAGAGIKFIIDDTSKLVSIQLKDSTSASFSDWWAIDVNTGIVNTDVDVYFKRSGTNDFRFTKETSDTAARIIEECVLDGGSFKVTKTIDPSNHVIDYVGDIGGTPTKIYSYNVSSDLFDYGNKYDATAKQFSFVGAGGTSTYSITVSSLSITANSSITGNVSIDGDVSITGDSIASGLLGGNSLHIKRGSSSSPMSIIFDDNGSKLAKAEVSANDTNFEFKVSPDGGSTWNNSYTLDTNNNKISINSDIVVSNKTDFSDNPYLEAYNSTTQSFGTNTVETLSFDTTFKSNDINVGLNNKDITVLRSGTYRVFLTLITSSQTASSNDEWQVLIENANTSSSHNVASAAAFWPNRSSNTGTKERWTFEFIVPANAGDIFRIKVQDINTNADVITSHIVVSRCV